MAGGSTGGGAGGASKGFSIGALGSGLSDMPGGGSNQVPGTNPFLDTIPYEPAPLSIPSLGQDQGQNVLQQLMALISQGSGQ